jgi:hypothetical protein
MKPEFILIDWSRGSMVGCGTEEECREQMVKATRNETHSRNAYLIAEVKVLSEMKRIES